MNAGTVLDHDRFLPSPFKFIEYNHPFTSFDDKHLQLIQRYFHHGLNRRVEIRKRTFAKKDRTHCQPKIRIHSCSRKPPVFLTRSFSNDSSLCEI
jgi:hypothetical protein